MSSTKVTVHLTRQGHICFNFPGKSSRAASKFGSSRDLHNEIRRLGPGCQAEKTLESKRRFLKVDWDVFLTGDDAEHFVNTHLPLVDRHGNPTSRKIHQKRYALEHGFPLKMEVPDEYFYP